MVKKLKYALIVIIWLLAAFFAYLAINKEQPVTIDGSNYYYQK